MADLSICLLALSALLFAAYSARAPILTAIANSWIVNEPLQKAGAIVVPGGATGRGEFGATQAKAELWIQVRERDRLLFSERRSSPV